MRPAIPGVKNIIAIASGKGGVGKSTTTANLAATLFNMHYQVGILDADIYGPNQPHMLGKTQHPYLQEDGRFEPVMRHGMQTISMADLVDINEPMIWRGPMIIKALQQLLYQTAWHHLDYLLIDLPPGTGDVQLTLSQKVPVNGVVIVTTPQDIALLDARRGLEMFRKVTIPILGIIENMSSYRCPTCHHEAAIFGEQGAEKLAKECNVLLLGQLPLLLEIRKQADLGVPIVITDPTGDIAKQYHSIALKIIEGITCP